MSLLPGAPEFPKDVANVIARVLATVKTAPRTRHLEADGSPKFSNRLTLATSPYLRQHAHNPVNWYPWGDEAFAAAKAANLPVLLSVGYSTCHWCHVMEEESFEDLAIAEFMNRHYVAIKVDREERPDVDATYMKVVQMMHGGGGWPMTVWLTAEREPFYGGTYFPPHDGARGSRVGFLTLLAHLSDAYRDERPRVSRAAEEMVEALRDRSAAAAGDEGAGDLAASSLTHWLDDACAYYRRGYDEAWGGLTGAPKFPSSLPIRLLHRQYLRTGDEQWRQMAAMTLKRMAQGGLCDQIGGGFHRYSTDRQWLVPHFEKMLYDNAQLVLAYLEHGQLARRQPGQPSQARAQEFAAEVFATVTRQTLDYMAREMVGPDGAFFTATDADSLRPDGEREEGWFFTWTPAELESLLGPDATLLAARFGVSEVGNFEGRTILSQVTTVAELARSFQLAEAEVMARLERSRLKLLAHRQTRPPPLLDNKHLASSNGLAITAFAEAGFVLADEAYLQVAKRAGEFVWQHMQHAGRLTHVYQAAGQGIPGYLDDYAFIIQGYLKLFERTAEAVWLERAKVLQASLDEHFWDHQQHGYFFTSDDQHERLLTTTRDKPAYDGAEPSGNAIAAMNLLRLAAFSGEESGAENGEEAYRQRAQQTVAAFRRVLERHPAAMSELLLAVDRLLATEQQIAVVLGSKQALGSQQLGADACLGVLRQQFLPHAVMLASQTAVGVSWWGDKSSIGDETTVYVCENFTCQRPTSDPVVLASLLGAPNPAGQAR